MQLNQQHAPMDDRSLLDKFVRGDIDSLGALAMRYESWLLALARAIVRDDALARDAVQEMWVRVIRHANGFAGESSVKTWMYRILVNRCIDLQNREQSRRGGQELLFAPVPAQTAEQRHEQSLDEPLERALATLDDKQRVLLLLHYHKGLTQDETAIVMGVPTGTIKSRLHAALARLREAMTTQHDASKEAAR